MTTIQRSLAPLLVALLLQGALAAQELRSRLADLLPDAKIEDLRAPRGFAEAFRIRLPQPLDHAAEDSATFDQRIYLSHRDFARPMVIDTEGYAAPTNRVQELTRLLEANQLVVEHRYFGESRPDPLEWRHLTVRQAAADHHRIIAAFKHLYRGKWISTGISKGGQTALIHRRYYPADVDATCAYVAPINRALEDPRIDAFFGEVGDAETRKALEAFQIAILKKRAEILPLLREHSAKRRFTYERIGLEGAFEYGVLEYPFSYWQWCQERTIPPRDADLAELFRHFVRVVDFRYYSDGGLDDIETFFYQSSNELGYYGYLTGHLKPLLKALERPDNRDFAPRGVETEFDPDVMKDVHAWLQTKGERILYIYGALDPWTASAIHPAEELDALCIIKAGAWHSVRLRHLSIEERSRVLAALERWLEVELKRH